jgi:hypothetical protein
MEKNRKAELLAELAAIEAAEKAEEIKRREATFALLWSNIDALIALTPDHDRTSCSDSDTCNGYGDSDRMPRCKRCFLLNQKSEGSWEAKDFTVELSISRLKPLETSTYKPSGI